MKYVVSVSNSFDRLQSLNNSTHPADLGKARTSIMISPRVHVGSEVADQVDYIQDTVIMATHNASLVDEDVTIHTAKNDRNVMQDGHQEDESLE